MILCCMFLSKRMYLVCASCVAAFCCVCNCFVVVCVVVVLSLCMNIRVLSGLSVCVLLYLSLRIVCYDVCSCVC